MGMVWVWMPRLCASSAASSREPCEENWLGMSRPMTLSGPSAWTASAAVRAESIPPESPRRARENPDLWK